jgi:hypothetical protein
LIHNIGSLGVGRLRFIVAARDRVELICKIQQSLINAMSGLISIFRGAVDVRQFGSGKRRQPQSDSVMHINAIGFNNDHESKAVVLAFTGCQAKLHIPQEVHCAVGSDSNLVLWQDEDHRLGNSIIIQPIQRPVHPDNRLL